MAGFFAADRPRSNNAPLEEGIKMAGYRKGFDQGQKEPEEAKAGEEKGQLDKKEHFGGGGMGKGKKMGKKHSRHSSRK